MIRRPPRSTQGVSSAASDVYKRQGIYNVSIGKKIYLSEIIDWLNRYNKKPVKVIRYKSSKNQNFYLNNKKLMSKIKIKNELSELKKECLILSRKLFN